MKKVLITGISGFVGKHLTEFLLAKGEYEIIGTSRSQESVENVILKKVDLLDKQAVEDLLTSQKPDVIVHLAAMTSPAESFKSPEATLTNNILAELNLLEVLKKHEMKQVRFLLVSTSEVYGLVNPSDIPVDEETPLRPASPYAVSKIAQDYLGLQYHLSYGLDIVRVRPFNHIGPGQQDKFVVPSFAKQIAEIEKGKQEPILKVGNLDAKRDFTDVRDIVSGYHLLLAQGKAGEVYNIGSGKSHKIGDMLNQLIALSTKEIRVETDPAKLRPVDIPEIVCDYAKLQKLTDWKPEISFEKTLEDILEYWRKLV